MMSWDKWLYLCALIFFGVVLRYACVVHLFCVLRSWFRLIHHRKFELSEKQYHRITYHGCSESNTQR